MTTIESYRFLESLSTSDSRQPASGLSHSHRISPQRSVAANYTSPTPQIHTPSPSKSRHIVSHVDDFPADSHPQPHYLMTTVASDLHSLHPVMGDAPWDSVTSLQMHHRLLPHPPRTWRDAAHPTKHHYELPTESSDLRTVHPSIWNPSNHDYPLRCPPERPVSSASITSLPPAQLTTRGWYPGSC